MDTTRILEIVRWIILVLGVINFSWILVRMSGNWEIYRTNNERAAGFILTLFVLGSTYGAAESIVRDVPVGSRALIILAAQVGLTSLLWKTRGSNLFEERKKR
jgi:hypothetical protein